MPLSAQLSYLVLRPALGVYNTLHRVFVRDRSTQPGSPEAQEIEKRARAQRTNISDHLTTIFQESVLIQPRLIVELGIGGGESHFVLERVARQCGAQLVSVDINDCSHACSHQTGCHVVQADDVEFAGRFQQWRKQQSIPSSAIDLLFLDTSHLYDHTVQELRAWFPLLSPHCKVIFHDTNLRYIMRRADGTLWLAWGNDRGVIRVIEEQLGTKLDERREFTTAAAGWKIRHWPFCIGLTVLER
jgi:cephalosporin hydroxylase